MNEPVAWHYPGGKADQCTTDKAYAEKDPAWTPMYYKHEWVGLTDKEIKLLANPPDEAKILMTGRMWIFVGDLMDKLKEKNA